MSNRTKDLIRQIRDIAIGIAAIALIWLAGYWVGYSSPATYREALHSAGRPINLHNMKPTGPTAAEVIRGSRGGQHLSEVFEVED